MHKSPLSPQVLFVYCKWDISYCVSMSIDEAMAGACLLRESHSITLKVEHCYNVTTLRLYFQQEQILVFLLSRGTILAIW